MLSILRRFLSRHRSDPAPESGGDDTEAAAQVAAAALLLESARADRSMDANERTLIESVLAERFRLDPDRVRTLVARAEDARRQAIDLYGFTSVIVRHRSHHQRLTLAEQIWRVMYADDHLTDDESILARRLGNLLELRPEEVAAVIRRVRDGTTRPG